MSEVAARPARPRHGRGFDLLAMLAIGVVIVAAALLPAVTANSGETTTVRGDVTVHGQPLAFFPVGFWTTAGTVAHTVTDASGGFTFDVSATIDGYAYAGTAPDAQRTGDQKVRENDVLTAWLWRTYGASSAVENNPMMYMSCPADLRRLLGEGNQALFGLSISWATARATHRELMLSPLGQLALRIQHSVARVFASDHATRTAPFEAMRRLHGVSALQSVQLRHPQHGMLVTNMSRLPLAQLDFGFGAPTTLRLVSELDGMAAIMPARDGVAISVCGRRSQSLVRHPPRTAAERSARTARA